MAGEFEDALTQVETELVASEEVEAEQAIDARRQRKILRQDRKVTPKFAEDAETFDVDSCPLLDSRSGCDGYAVAQISQVVSA